MHTSGRCYFYILLGYVYHKAACVTTSPVFPVPFPSLRYTFSRYALSSGDYNKELTRFILQRIL